MEIAGNSEEKVCTGAMKLIDKYKDDFDQECSSEFVEFGFHYKNRVRK